MVELIVKRFGKWVYVYNGLDACPLRCFLYWEWLQLFDIPVKEGTRKKVKVEEVAHEERVNLKKILIKADSSC